MTNVNCGETNGITLLPCPFCGGEAATHEVGFPYHYWDVWCDGECFDHFCEKPTEAEAIAAWNTRMPEQAIAATLGANDGITPKSDVRAADVDANDANATLGGGECMMEYGGDVTEGTARAMGVYFCSECGSPNYNDCMPHYCIYCGKAVER